MNDESPAASPGTDIRPVRRESRDGLRWTQAELDEAIFSAEMEVMRRDRRIERHANAFGQSLRERTRQSVRVGAVASVVGLGAYAIWALLARRRPRPAHTAAEPQQDRSARGRESAQEPPRRGAGQAVAAGIVDLMPLFWPWLPGRWRDRVPLPAAMVIAGWAMPVLGLLRGRGRRR